jgi:tRNA-2-methylthio-N6-dimethylallyladenosine synthase
VGFPGEGEEDFAETLRVVEASRFATAFTFQYSIRPGTPAATMPDQVPPGVVQERFERLVALQDGISWEENKALLGTDVSVLIATGEGKKDKKTDRLSGRAKDGRLVHVGGPWPDGPPRPGDIVTARVTDAKPFFLIADPTPNTPATIRRTSAGDAHDRAQADSCAAPSSPPAPGGVAGKPVSLGLPTLRIGR